MVQIYSRSLYTVVPGSAACRTYQLELVDTGSEFSVDKQGEARESVPGVGKPTGLLRLWTITTTTESSRSCTLPKLVVLKTRPTKSHVVVRISGWMIATPPRAVTDLIQSVGIRVKRRIVPNLVMKREFYLSHILIPVRRCYPSVGPHFCRVV